MSGSSVLESIEEENQTHAFYSENVWLFVKLNRMNLKVMRSRFIFKSLFICFCSIRTFFTKNEQTLF